MTHPRHNMKSGFLLEAVVFPLAVGELNSESQGVQHFLSLLSASISATEEKYILFQKLVSPNVARIIQESLLEEVSRQKQVLETVSRLSDLEAGSFTSAEESK